MTPSSFKCNILNQRRFRETEGPVKPTQGTGLHSWSAAITNNWSAALWEQASVIPLASERPTLLGEEARFNSFPAMLSFLSDCFHINKTLLPMGSGVHPALQHATAAAAVSQLLINPLLYYANRTLLVCQDLLLFIVGGSAWSTFYRAQMFPLEERDAGCAV